MIGGRPYAEEAKDFNLETIPSGVPLTDREMFDVMQRLHEDGKAFRIRTYSCVFYVQAWRRLSLRVDRLKLEISGTRRPQQRRAVGSVRMTRCWNSSSERTRCAISSGATETRIQRTCRLALLSRVDSGRVARLSPFLHAVGPRRPRRRAEQSEMAPDGGRSPVPPWRVSPDCLYFGDHERTRHCHCPCPGSHRSAAGSGWPAGPDACRGEGVGDRGRCLRPGASAVARRGTHPALRARRLRGRGRKGVSGPRPRRSSHWATGSSLPSRWRTGPSGPMGP